jgi:ABC-2 type transport system permease protein
MRGRLSALQAITRKEVADHFSSDRFLILFSLVVLVSVLMVYMAGVKIGQDMEGHAKPTFIFLTLFTASSIGFPLVQFVALFGPLIGLILGFDAINREWNEGTLSKLLAQPIHRDAVINGKFLAGLVVILVTLLSILLAVTGLGLATLGIVPGAEELMRIFAYFVVSVLYVAFWLAVAILFSLLSRSITTSALASLAAWIFFSFLVPLGASAIANGLGPLAGESNTDFILRSAELERGLSLVSPQRIYSECMAVIVDPLRQTASSIVAMGRFEEISLSRFSGPLPLDQSLLMVFPQLVFLAAILVVCFSVSYVVFLRKEIRSL